MKAITLRSYGGPDQLELAEVERPRPRLDEVLVRVSGAAVNPIDLRRRRGDFASNGAPLPLILGNAVAGNVEVAGPICRRFSKGSSVIGRCTNAYAEFVCVKIDDLAFAPVNLALASAARIPIAAGVAWLYLFETGELKPRQEVLIHGANGAVGQFAIQLARLAGAKVLTTSAPVHFDHLSDLGADHCFDYRQHDWRQLRSVDLVLDPVGGELREHSWPVLRHGGMMVSLTGPLDEQMAARRGLVARHSRRDVNGAILANIVSLIEAGLVRVPAGRNMRFAEANLAHTLVEGRAAGGPIVLCP